MTTIANTTTLNVVRSIPGFCLTPAWIGWRWTVHGTPHHGWCLRNRSAYFMALGCALACACEVEP